MSWKNQSRKCDAFAVCIEQNGCFAQKYFTVGECIAHLDYLIKGVRLRCEERGGRLFTIRWNRYKRSPRAGGAVRPLPGPFSRPSPGGSPCGRAGAGAALS